MVRLTRAAWNIGTHSLQTVRAEAPSLSGSCTRRSSASTSWTPNTTSCSVVLLIRRDYRTG